jgi:hypothetical protein
LLWFSGLTQRHKERASLRVQKRRPPLRAAS